MHWSQSRKWSGPSIGSTGVGRPSWLLSRAPSALTVGLFQGVRFSVPFSPAKRIRLPPLFPKWVV